MNLLLSYCQRDDIEANAKGYKFLGAAYDSEDGEVHVFEIMSIEKACTLKYTEGEYL